MKVILIWIYLIFTMLVSLYSWINVSYDSIYLLVLNIFCLLGLILIRKNIDKLGE